MLRIIRDAIELKMIGVARKFAESERGDTNFISIIIILGIAMLLAITFMGFKDTIVRMVQDIIGDFSIH